MTDPNFANVVTLLHFEGQDTSQDFTDSSISSTDWTARAAGDQIDDAQFKFGASSLAVSEGVSVGNIPTFDFGLGDFTWECWHRPTSRPTFAYIFSSSSGSGAVGCNVEYGTTRDGWVVSINGDEIIGDDVPNGGAGDLPTVNVWQHIALTNESGTLRLFLDGVLQGSGTTSESFTNGNNFAVGDLGDPTPSGFPVTGHIDDVRITKGVARYTANFTPPTEAFPDNAVPPTEETSLFAHGQCRLTLDGSNLKLSRRDGKWLIINGTSQEIPSAGVTLTSGGLTADTTYFIYAAMSGGTMILVASTTTHSTDDETGVEIEAGDAARTLVGMARTNGSAQFVDSESQRLVITYFNRRPLRAWVQLSSTTVTSSTMTQIGSEQLEFLSWGDDAASFNMNGVYSVVSSSVTGRYQIRLDGVRLGVNEYTSTQSPAGFTDTIGAFATASPTAGYHTVQGFHRVDTSQSMTSFTDLQGIVTG